MIVTVQEFNNYTGDYEDNADAVGVKTICLQSAEQLVKDYLRYDPQQQDYTNVLVNGTGKKYLPLPAVNITAISALEIDGVTQTVSNFVIYNDCIRYSDLKTIFTAGDENIKVSFTAGYDTVPDDIKLTILRIATLMLMEAGENIGVSGKSMPDNSRTFINYTNYNKYLTPIQNRRLAVF